MDPRIARSRQKLLDAATTLLVESGPDSLTVDAVAERSGVAKSTLYRHWPSRDELLLDVMRNLMPQIPPIEPGTGFEAALFAFTDAVAETFADEAWGSVLVSLIALQRHRPELTELFKQDHKAQLRALDEVLRLGIDEGRLPEDVDLQLSAELLIGPPLMVTISGELDRVHVVARRSAERFIASYAGATRRTKRAPQR